MGDNLGVVGLRQPLESLRHATVVVDEEILHVIIHAPNTISCLPLAPTQALEEGREQRLCPLAQPLNEIRVSPEEVLHAVVIILSVCTDREQVLNHGGGCLKAAAVDGPHQRRNLLLAYLDEKHRVRPGVAGRDAHSLLQHRRRVQVDRLHDDRGALVDRPHEDLRDEPEGPAEGLERCFVRRRRGHSLDVRRDEGGDEICRNRVTDVAEAQAGNLVDHADRILEHLDGHFEDPTTDKIQPRVGLLEEVLPGRRHAEEA
mmetsp:Transcript_121380/g.343489  ORF Transcript_121380/g.343489 Transcript_121380/m.343489 type:complete len:259 (-) Transcript_121380:1310-2086(-)